MSKFHIGRPDKAKIGLQGALEAACVDLGSVESIDISFDAEARFATASKYRGANVEGTVDAANGSINIVCEELSVELFQYLTGATYGANKLAVDGTGGDPVYLTAYIGPIKIDGDVHDFHPVKLMVNPAFSLNLNAEQSKVTLPLMMMVDPEAAGTKFYEFLKRSADTTAPTVTCAPVDGATNVSKTNAIVWTFSEAIRSVDATAEHFFVSKADGTIVAGTLAVGNDNTTVSFTPASAMSGATDHIAVCVKGVRDVAGNELAATSIVNFTTAA